MRTRRGRTRPRTATVWPGGTSTRSADRRSRALRGALRLQVDGAGQRALVVQLQAHPLAEDGARLARRGGRRVIWPGASTISTTSVSAVTPVARPVTGSSAWTASAIGYRAASVPIAGRNATSARTLSPGASARLRLGCRQPRRVQAVHAQRQHPGHGRGVGQQHRAGDDRAGAAVQHRRHLDARLRLERAGPNRAGQPPTLTSITPVSTAWLGATVTTCDFNGVLPGVCRTSMT